MDQKLRILFAEDVAMDYELALGIIKKEGIVAAAMLVETAAAFEDALRKFKPDVVISDYSMPQFDGLQALGLTRAFDEHIPFIILTGSRNEEIAVSCMREGADDYVIKENMKRLPFAVIETFKLKQALREKDIYLKELQEKENLFQMITENSTDVLFLLDLKLNYQYVSPAVKGLNGFSVEETLKQHITEILTPESQQLIQKVFEEEYKNEISGKNPPDHKRTIAFTEYDNKRNVIWVESALKFVHDDDGKPIGVMGVSRDITAKKLAEKSIKESEALLNYSQQIAQMGSFELDIETGKVSWSEHNYRIMGLEPFSIEPDLNYFHSLIHPEDTLRVKDTMEQLQKEKKPISYTFRIIWPDGQIRWLQNEVVPFFSDGKLTHLKGVNLDITERKQEQQQLLDTDTRLNLALDASNQGLYDHYLQTDEILVNDYYARMLGYDPKTFKETTAFWIERMHPDDREEVMKAFNDYLSGKTEEYRSEFRQKTKSGGWKWTLSMGRIVEYDKSGKPYRMLGTHIDIDRTKRNEIQLAEAKNYLELLIHSIDAPIIEWDHNLMITRFNKATEQLTGIKTEEAIGASIEKFFQLAVTPNLDELIDRVVVKGGVLAGDEVAIKTQDGSLRTLLWHSTNIIDPQSNEQTATVAIGYDITELLKIQGDLRQSEHSHKQIVENAPIGIIKFDEQLVIQNLNARFAEIIGTSPQKLKGLDMKMLPNNDLNLALQEVAKGKIAKYEGLYQAYTTGKQTFIKAIFAPLFSTEKEVIGGVGIVEDISEQVVAQKHIKESEERFSKTFYSSPVSKALIALDGFTVFDVNDAWCRFTGYTREMALGAKVMDLKFIDEAVFKEILDEQARLDAVFQSEVLFSDRTGNEKTGLLSAEKYNMAGKDFLIVAILDITERKLAELELTKLTRAVEQSPVSIVITDLEGTVEYVNPRVTEVTGYLPHELIGQNPRVFSSGEKPQEEYLEMYQTLQKGEVWTGEFHNKKKDGTLFWEKATIAPVINDEGLMTHYLAVKEDITMVKQLAQNLVESEKRYRDMFFNSPLPMWIYDVNTLRFEEVNQVAISRYGYTEKEFKSMTIEAVRPEEDLDLLYENIKNVTNEFQDKQVWRHKTKDGRLMDVEIVSHAIPSPPGKKLRLVLVNDVTEKIKAANTLRDAKALAEASDRLKTNFLNSISHEVRTPLNGIMGAATLMGDTGMSEEELNELVEIIQESSDRLIQTITDYMDISLLTSQNMEAYRKRVDVSNTLKMAAAKYEHKFKSKNLEFKLEAQDLDLAVKLLSDEELISKALFHLLSNAYKFTNQGSVVLGCKTHDSTLELFVSDTGIGIARENQERIFEHFTQEDQSSVRRFEGSGLGLSIVNGIAKVLGGEVRLESEKGKGSRFSLVLPLEKQKKADDIEKPVLMAQSPVVLIAEDEDSNFYVLELLMRQMDVSAVIRVENGVEAVDLAMQRDDIGIILMDIKMPEMDGLEATKLIKAHKPGLPIIAITAFAMSGDEQRIKEAGCDDYMAKPISMKKLIEKLKVFGLKIKS
jgi:PAS domain S-box-containing protein